MVFHKVKYITFSGVKEIIEVPIKKTSKWVIYEDNIPKYFVDFFDLEKESNAIMNSLVLCSKQSIETVLALINKKIMSNYLFQKFLLWDLKSKQNLKLSN